ncbi:MAG: hypothetical protein NXI24_21130 [bacterium]|nr:hypothetical protein [bacterium]
MRNPELDLRRLTLRLLRSDAARGFSAGLVAGAMICGLCLSAGYFALSWFRWPVALIAPLSPSGANAMPAITELSPPELKLTFAAFLNGKATLIVGSSEVGGAPPDFVSMSNRVAACAAGTPFVMPQPRYGGLYRAALLIERLRGGFAADQPVRLIVLDNSHYSTAATEAWPAPRSDLGTPTHLQHHLLRNPQSILYETPGFPDSAGRQNHRSRFAFAQARLLEWRSFRHMLTRRVVRPLRQALTATGGSPTNDSRTQSPAPSQATRSADWQVATRFVPAIGRRAELRRRKALQNDLANAVYGRAAAALAARARKILPAGSEVQVLALPLHEKFYRRLGFSAAALREMRSQRLGVLAASFENSPVRMRVAQELAPGEFYYDSIHYSAPGRERLALSLCKAMRGEAFR